MSKDKYLRLGKVGKAQGLKGHFYVSDRDERLPQIKEVFLAQTPLELKGFKVRSQSWTGERNTLSLVGIDDRTAAESFLHKDIWMPRADLRLKTNEVLWVDLEGLEVFASDETSMGHVRCIANYGASDIVEIVKDGKLISLPLNADYFDLSFYETAHRVENKTTHEHETSIGPLRLVQDAAFFSEYWEEDKDA